ncbi:MAG: hypothetical protein ACOC9T_01425 [Myxococcota bacterium]
MNVVMRSVGLVGLGFGLLVLQSTLATLISWHPLEPNLLLPIVIFLGVSPNVRIARGAAISFALGYLLDLFCGNLMSLQTFVMVATFMLARGAGLRLVLRGPVFQVVLTFVVGVLTSGAVLALRAIFEERPPFPAGTAGGTLLSIVGPAFVTAVAAPVIFLAARRIDSRTVRRREEAGVTP